MKKCIIILFAALAISACVDLFQEPQSDLTSETIILTKPTLEAMVNGLYKSFWSNNYGFNCRIASLGLSADDMITGSIKKIRNTQDDQMKVPIDNPDVAVLWKSFYKTIFDANNLIYNIKGNPELDAELGSIYLGEAYFFRALSYFYVIRYFGDAPAITDPTSSADIDGIKSMPRKKVKDIYDKIIVPDLLEAEKLLKDKSRDDKNQAPTVWAAKTLLTDVYITMAGWPLKEEHYYAEAAKKAKEIIEGKAHALMPHYKDLWMEANKTDKTEHIFALQHSLTYLPSQYGISYLGVEEGNGWSDYSADPVFFNNFPDDTRKAFSYVTSTRNSKTDKEIDWTEFASGGPYIRKYRNYGGCGNYGIEGASSPRNQLSQGLTPIYRYADVLLLYAEASNKAEGGPNELAYDCINKVRDRAFGDTNHRLSGLNQEQFAKAVFDEFGWENVFEFKRWFQLVRTEMVDEAVGKNAQVEARLGVDKQNYLFPVPVRQVELRSWVNNPGY